MSTKLASVAPVVVAADSTVVEVAVEDTTVVEVHTAEVVVDMAEVVVVVRADTEANQVVDTVVARVATEVVVVSFFFLDPFVPSNADHQIKDTRVVRVAAMVEASSSRVVAAGIRCLLDVIFSPTSRVRTN